jgi:ribonuclease HI
MSGSWFTNPSKIMVAIQSARRRCRRDRRQVPRAAAERASCSAMQRSSNGGSRPATIVYTDGACSGNPGPGGWAWAVAPDGTLSASGSAPATTNQRMEITAALEAVRTLAPGGPLVVMSDSSYVVNCFRDGWWRGWERNGWRNSKRQPVANRDLWEPLVELVKQFDVTFRWVKGHGSDPLNDLVDRMAVAAAIAQ